jgi:uncharacterized lipoprotein YajG
MKMKLLLFLFAIPLLLTGCATPEQSQAWGQVLQGMANTSQNSFNQYQMNQMQQQIWHMQGF